MKKSFKALLYIFVLSVLLIPSIKANAYVDPSTPSGISFYGQDGAKFGFKWNYDQNLELSTDIDGLFGYEIVFTKVNNKKIATVDTANLVYNTDWNVDTSYKVNMLLTNSKLKKQPFKIKVRAYVYDEAGNKHYGSFSKAKTIVPRATITSKGLTSKSSNNVKIKWSKVSGAKSYSVYVSTSKTSGYKKKATVTGTSYIIKNNKSYTNYYVYVVANKVKCGKKKLNSTKPTLKYSNMSAYYIYTKYSY